MIKKILLSLGLILIGLINFTNGYYTAYIDTDNDMSTNYPNATFNPDSDGNFNMTVNGETKNVFYLNFDGGSWFVHRTMYFYYNEDNLNFWAKQRGYYYTGLVNKFRISTASDIPNLNLFDWFNGTGTREDVKNSGIGGHITSILYNPISSSADTPGGNFCFISNDLDLSVCVSCYGSNGFVGCSTDYAGGELITDDNSFYFNNLDNSLLKLSALVDNSGGGNSIISGTGQYVELTGNLVYSDEKCTYGELIKYLQEAGYNKYLCYGGLDNFDTFDSTLNYSPIPGTGKTLGQILTNASSTWDSSFEWFAFWNGLYQDRNNYISIWESYPAVYRTWFDLYYQYGGSDLIFETVNEYCTMVSLVSDYTDFYNGTYFRSACQNYIIPSRSKTGDNAVSLNWGGIFGSGDSTELQNGKTFISEFFTQIKNNIIVPDKSDFGLGILPSYIIWALLGLILFRFLSH